MQIYLNYCSKAVKLISKYLSASIDFAIKSRNVECLMKLFKKTVCKEICYDWARAAHMGSVELLKCMLNHGIDKDHTDEAGQSLLTWTIRSGKPEAVRYLLDIGVTVPKYDPKSEFELCKKCGNNKMILDYNFFGKCVDNPCARAILMDIPEIVEMLVDQGQQGCSSFNALAVAVRSSSVNVVEYLLNTYRYPINCEYIWPGFGSGYETLITEYNEKHSIVIVKLLLAHGADPNTQTCDGSPLIKALCLRNEELIALFIRNGVNINFDSTSLPFEASILCNRLFATEMLLVSGCSRGMYSRGNLYEKLTNIKSKVMDLIKKWNVHENNVIPLKMQCRRMILNHLSPQADKKITKLPLPPSVIIYLSIPELDDIVDACRKSTQTQ